MKHRSPNLALNAKYVQSNNRQGTFFAKIQFLPVHSIYFVLVGYGLKLKVRTFPLPLSLLKFSILLVACACSFPFYGLHCCFGILSTLFVSRLSSIIGRLPTNEAKR